MLPKRLFIFLFLLFSPFLSPAQENRLNFYLPAGGGYSYDENIPAPADILGFEIGDQHVTYEQALNYIRTLAQKSGRALYYESGRSYEYKPLGFLVISSPENIAKIEAIRSNQQKLADPFVSGEPDLKEMPVVVYLAYSVHGNEASGINASLPVAYFFTAAQGGNIDEILKNTVILIQPGQNPDGIQKFATWVNSARSFTPVTDNNSLEFREPYTPSSRANHYWFDLNRDWLTVQHPESRGRMAFYYRWRPTVVGDFHEHGSTNGAFFSPGKSTSIDKNIPADNYKWSEVFGKYHGDTLSSIGTLYFSKEGYDDFFTGKGAALPDLQGGVAMLFEQPSSRGHIQRRNGVLLRFCDQIRNQAYCSYSTVTAALDNREGLLAYHRDTYREAERLAKNDPVKGYIFGGGGSVDKEFLKILGAHQINVYRLSGDFQKNGQIYKAEDSYVVPLAQPEYRTVKTIFEKDKPYKDSTFYDISTWTLPLAMNLNYAELGREIPALGRQILPESIQDMPENGRIGTGSYGYCFPITDYYSYKVLYRLLSAGMQLRVASTPFELKVDGKNVNFDRGTIVVYNKLQEMTKERVHALVCEAAAGVPAEIYPLHSGTGLKTDLGSRSFKAVTMPRIAILCGNGVTASETGELWYLLDRKFSIPATMLDISRLETADLAAYNIIVADGNYKPGKKGMERLALWLENKDHKLIAVNNAFSLVNALGKAEIRLQKGISAIEGVILETTVNRTDPLCYGITSPVVPVFKNNKIALESSVPGGVLRYSGQPLLSGCTRPGNIEKLAGTPSVLVTGNVIYFSFAPFFRGYFFGSSRLFLNALFF